MASVVFTEPAECDLLDIENYIFAELLRSVGLRMTYFDNYNIFYYYDRENDRVYIIRVLYNRVDWQNLLKT